MLQAVPATPLARYRWETTQPDFVADPLQEAAAARLDALWQTIVRPPKRGWLARLSGRSTPAPSVGAYLWGDVGRGKSYLLDLFFDCLPGERKRRLHFHEFMRAVHAARRRLGDIPDPLPRIVDEWAGRADVLCFDEFQVHDIADAMLLAGLLRELLDRGVYVVATSNRRPDDLYLHGLQRARFVPTIALIKERLDVIELNGPTDYRRRALHDVRRYLTPLGARAEAGMAAAFRHLVPEHEKTGPLKVHGRIIEVRHRGSDVAWFDFDALCRRAFPHRAVVRRAATQRRRVRRGASVHEPGRRAVRPGREPHRVGRRPACRAVPGRAHGLRVPAHGEPADRDAVGRLAR
jgi:cell division protein ZapE